MARSTDECSLAVINKRFGDFWVNVELHLFDFSVLSIPHLLPSDWRSLLAICCNIALVLPVSVFSVFMPLIVKGMGYKALEANLMSITPFVA